MRALHAAPHARPFLHAPDEQQLRRRIDASAFEQRIVLDGDVPVGMWAMALHQDWLAEFVRIVVLAPGRGIGTFALRRMLARVRRPAAAPRVP